MNDTIKPKRKLQALGERTPVWIFILAIAVGGLLIAIQVRNWIAWEDTQGVEYDQARLKAFRGGSGGGYGEGRPSAPGQPGGGGNSGR